MEKIMKRKSKIILGIIIFILFFIIALEIVVSSDKSKQEFESSIQEDNETETLIYEIQTENNKSIQITTEPFANKEVSRYLLLEQLPLDFNEESISLILGKTDGERWYIDDFNYVTYDNGVFTLILDNIKAVVDSNMTLKDYDMLMLQCQSGTLSVWETQLLLNCTGCLVYGDKDKFVYKFYQSNSRVVTIEYNRNTGIVDEIYEIF